MKLDHPDVENGGSLYVDRLRFDAVFVTTGEVWTIYCELREVWGGDVNCNAFVDLCHWERRMAMKCNDPEAAKLWKAVHGFGLSYSISHVSAIEVDGVLFRENEDVPASAYPADAALKRILFVP